MRHLNKIFITLFLMVAALSIAGISVNAQTAANKITPGTFQNFSKTSGLSATATAGLQQFYSSTGKYTLSADGIGSTSSSMNIRVNKPNAQATVQKAILLSSVTFDQITNGCVTLAGVGVNWDGSAASTFFHSYWADVTSIVADQINGFSPGISNIAITECNTARVEGEALLVIFNDPAATEKTIIVMVGALNTAGDNFPVTLAKAIDPTKTGALLDMGLGIGFSYQLNGVQQFSDVSVNGQRITSSAGGEDDGQDANGALMTVGGIGDDNLNPTNPFATPTNPRSDDELYSILPFITDTTTSLNINTVNPSNDDNVFLAYFALSGAAIIGEGILLSQDDASGNVGTSHTVKAAVLDANGHPVTNRLVTFTITSGPNAGNTFSKNTNSSGEAEYTYTGSGGVGIDSIEACFTNSQSNQSCSNVLAFEWTQVIVDTPTGICPKNDTVFASSCNGTAIIKWTPPSKQYPDSILIPGYPGPGKGIMTYGGSLGGHGYYLSNKGTTLWTAGTDFAQFLTGKGIKGHLATLTSAAENTFVTNLVSPTGYSHQIGLFNFQSPTNFLWITGEPFKYKNWAAGQPDNHGGTATKIKEHYVVIRPNGTWNDTVPVRLPFVAEFDKPLYIYRQIAGPANGSSQSIGDYTVCYERTNLITTKKDTCCFTISVQCHATLQSRASNMSSLSAQGLKVVSYPNPSHDNFSLNIASGNKTELVSIRITDHMGRVVEARTGIAPNQNLKVGSSLKPGFYIIQVTQGTSKVVSKLIKE